LREIAASILGGEREDESLSIEKYTIEKYFD
jgi:hypothetical protein